ncbi:MAG: hypothetical protein R3Y24_11075 [Eubacteriales bacterium]
MKLKTIALIAAQIAFLVLWNVRLFSDPVEINITTSEIFENNENNVMSLTEENDLLLEDNSSNLIYVNSPTFDLPAGAYYVSVVYESARSEVGSIESNSGTIDFYSGENQSAILVEELLLTDARSVLDGRLWIQSPVSVDDVFMRITYYGQGTLSIENITIAESVTYRYVQLLVSLLILLAVHVIYRLFIRYQDNSIEKTKMILLLILGISLASLPLFSNFLYDGDDINYHLMRIVSLSTEVEYGQFPVRIGTDLANGYGYISSLFYCDLFLYLPAFLYSCMVPLRVCYQIYVVFINLATVLCAYYSFKLMTKDRTISIIGTSLYTFAAYRLVNIYVRAAVGEYTAMVFLPLVVAGMYALYSKKEIIWKDWILLALGMSGLILSHILTTQMVVLFLILFCVITIRKTLYIPRLLALLKATGITILLTAWFVFPFLESMMTNDIKVMHWVVQKIQGQGTYLVQLFSLLVSGVVGTNVNAIQGEAAYTLGFSFAIGIVCILYCCIHRMEWNLKDSLSYKTSLLLAGLSGVAILFSMQIFPWDGMEDLFGYEVANWMGKIQFPWRYLSIASILLVAAIVFILQVIKEKKLQYYKIAGIFIIASSLVTTTSFYDTLINEMEIVQAADLQDKNTILDGGIGGGFEYLLQETDYSKLMTCSYVIENDNIIVDSYKKINGKTEITVVNTSDEEGMITLPILYYQNYQARDVLTGENLEIVEGENTCIAVSIEAGYEGTIEVAYQAPLRWRIAEMISLLTGIVIMIGVIKKYRKS